MRNKRNIRVSPYLWIIAGITLACSILYYLPEIVGLVGWTSLQTTLGKLHNFYVVDLYAMVFFAPVVYAAYVFGTKWSLLTALICMLILLPYSILIDNYPNALFKPTSFAIILSAVGAVAAMLQRSDQQRRTSMKELKCLYDVGKAAEESDSVEGFLSSIVELIPQAAPCPRETKVKVVVRDKVFQSPGFEESSGKIAEDLTMGGEVLGSVEIYYTRSSPHVEKQTHLIKTLAERIGGAVREIELEQSLKGYYEQLEDMVETRTRDLEQAQEQLRLLSDTVKSSFDGITLADMEGNLTFVNEASQKMWCYSYDDLTQMKMSQLYTPDELEFVEEEIIPGSRTEVWTGELTAVRKDGSQFPVLVTTSPVHDEKGETIAIVGVHRDISETQEMRDKLIRSERLAAVGELASGVGHELRNPLNVIRNCAYLLRMSLDDEVDEEELNTLGLLDKQIDIANKIVTDLLDFTRIKPPSRTRVDLGNLIKESLSWVTVPENVKVTADLNGDFPRIVADAEQVGRAFANIISNAVQSMNGNGKLRISTSVDDSLAWVKFEDNGCGISEENLEKIFEPLFTTKPKGIGLGLAITKRLIEQNDGKIAVNSQVGKGTTFTTRLPLRKRRS
ncbi:nitrogen regulation protein NR(II) [Chloroflexota bacterium]